MVARFLLSLRAVLIFMTDQARTIVFLCGLLLLHTGLRQVEAWAPGAAWAVPGLIVIAVAIFGVRGGMAPPSQRRTR